MAPRDPSTMLDRVRELVIALMMILAFSSFVRAQTNTQSGATKSEAVPPRDLSGIWYGGVGGGLRIRGKVPPMLPEAQAKFDSNIAELKSDRTITADPTFRCEPAGLPHIYGIGGYQVEIVQTPARIFLFYESVHTFRTIWMDGRKVPEDADPLWMGFSVGHWDGNDLVVDTTGFNDKTWLNGAGYPHSEALHITERFHRVDRNHMQLDITIEDPKSYTQPWKMGINFTLQTTWGFGESFCIPTDEANFKTQVMEPNDKDKPGVQSGR